MIKTTSKSISATSYHIIPILTRGGYLEILRKSAHSYMNVRLIIFHSTYASITISILFRTYNPSIHNKPQNQYLYTVTVFEPYANAASCVAKNISM